MGLKEVKDLNERIIAAERDAMSLGSGPGLDKAEQDIRRLKKALKEEKNMLSPKELSMFELGLQSKEAFSDAILGDIFSSSDIDDQTNHLMEEVAKSNDDMNEELRELEAMLEKQEAQEEFDLRASFTTFDFEDAQESLEEDIRRLEDAYDLLDKIPDLDMKDVPPDVQADMLINAQLIAESNNVAKMALGAEIARSYAEVYKHNHTSTSTNENGFFAQIKEMFKQGVEKLIDTCKSKLDDIISKLKDDNAPDEPEQESSHETKLQ